jgi:hypothetical protein
MALVASLLAVVGVVAGVSPAAAAACGTGSTPNSINVAPLQGSIFTADFPPGKQALDGLYEGWQITNSTGAALNGAWVKIDNFTGGVVYRPTVEDGVDQLVNLGNGASDYSYFFLGATAETLAAQSHTVQVFDRRPDLPGAIELCNRTFTYTEVRDTIQANANKVDVSTSVANPPALGAIMTMTVTGNLGNVGSQDILRLSPASIATGTKAWPANVLELTAVNINVSLNGAAAQNHPHQLQHSVTNGGSSIPYTATYTFRIIGTRPANTEISPVAYVGSGTQIKHADVDGYATNNAIQPIQPPVNTTVVNKSANRTKVANQFATNVTYTLTATNSSTTQAASLDSFVDTLPSGVSYVANSAQFNGVSTSNPSISGSQLTFVGPFSIPANSSRTLTYVVTFASGLSGTKTNSAYGLIGTTQIDTTVSTSTNVPATSTITVQQPPATVADSYTTLANTTLTVPASGVLSNDNLGTASTLSLVTSPSNASSFTLNTNGSFSYTRTTNTSGTDSFQYRLTDDLGQVSTATVTVNTTPIAIDNSGTTTANTPLVVSPSGILGNDIGTGLTVLSSTSTTNGTVTVNANGSYTYTPNAGFSGTDSFTYVARDSSTLSSNTATVNLTVTPTATNDSYSTPFQTTLTGSTVLANDAGSALGSTSLVSGPSNASNFTLNADGTFTYVPQAGFAGTDSFTYRATDSSGQLTNIATVTINVAMPSGPVAAADSYTTSANTTLTVPATGVLGNDTGSSVTVTSNTNPSHGTVTVNADGSFSYVPAAGYSGPDSFTYTITDGFGRTSTATVQLTVTPTANDDSYTVVSGNTLTVPAAGILTNDVGSTLQVTSNTTPSGGTVTVNPNGSFSYTPSALFEGTDTFTYTVTDASGQTSTATVSILVTNAPPVAVDDTATTSANTPLTIPVVGNDSDPDGHPVSVMGVGTPLSGGSASFTGTTVTYTPPSNFTGYDLVSYTITDGHGKTDTAWVKIFVTVAPDGSSPSDTNGAPGTLIGNDSMLIVGIGGPNPGTGLTDHTQVVNTQPVRFSNQQLVIKLQNGFRPAVGDTFDIVTFAGSVPDPKYTGAFGRVYGQVMPDGVVLEVQYLSDRIRLEAVRAQFVVPTTDAVDATAGDATCASAGGDCTVRAAVMESNALAGRGAVVLPPNTTVALGLAGAGEDAAVAGDLDVTDSLAILGQGSTLDAALLDRALEVRGNASFSATNLTVTRGRAQTANGGAGGIHVAGGSVGLVDVAFTDNRGDAGGGLGIATGTARMVRGRIAGGVGATGGGAYSAAPITLDGVTVESNTTTGHGGGVAVAPGGSLNLWNASVRTNTAANGGGLHVASGATAVIRTTTISANSASSNGGGISAAGATTLTEARITANTAAQGAGVHATAPLGVLRVTLDANVASTRGGGIVSSATATIDTSTLSGNRAPAGAALITDGGTSTVLSTTITANQATGPGATAVLAAGGTTTVRNSIVADQLAPTAANCAAAGGVLSSNQYNLAGDSSCGFTSTGDQQGVSAQLNGLLNNGGFAPTHKPRTTSPVLNTGAPTCTGPDQRNFARPRGTACEKGSIEL